MINSLWSKTNPEFCNPLARAGSLGARPRELGRVRLRRRIYAVSAVMAIAAVLALPSRTAVAQSETPTMSTVDPASGKVNDDITVTGTNLGKSSISSVFLSDDKNDYKASIVEQSDTKIVMKVPQVKAGSYNVSYQKGNAIFIQPVRFKVE